MAILLTFTGFNDPYFKGLVGQEEQLGPVLYLLSARSFDRVFLFSTPNTEEITVETKNAITSLHPGVAVEILDVPLDDPTDYVAILRGLRKHVQNIQENYRDGTYYGTVASGTPQMHACWVLLAASGEIPGGLLHVRPPRFVTKDRPPVTEIDLTSREFPVVRSQIAASSVVDNGVVDIESAIQKMGGSIGSTRSG